VRRIQSGARVTHVGGVRGTSRYGKVDYQSHSANFYTMRRCSARGSVCIYHFWQLWLQLSDCFKTMIMQTMVTFLLKIHTFHCL